MAAHHETHASLKARGHKDHAEQLRHHAGHAAGGKIGKEEIRSAIAQHESHDHKGAKKTHLTLHAGGHVEGAKAGKRLDRASGGRTNKSSKHAPSVHVNVISAPSRTPVAPAAMMPPPAMHPPMPGGAPPPIPGGGMPPGAMPPAGGMPPRPPMAGPPVSAGVPGMMRAKGGRVKYPLEDGGRSGPGRLQKAEAYGRKAPAGENHGEVSDLEDVSAGSGKEKMRRGGRAK